MPFDFFAQFARRRHAVQQQPNGPPFLLCQIKRGIHGPQISGRWLQGHQHQISTANGKARIRIIMRRGIQQQKILLPLQPFQSRGQAPAGRGLKMQRTRFFALAALLVPARQAALRVYIQQPDAMARFRQSSGQIGRHSGFAGAALALGDGDHEGHARLQCPLKSYSSLARRLIQPMPAIS